MFNSVQLVPFHDSVSAEPGCPAKAKAAVLVPTPGKARLAVFKSFTSVQLDPFHVSVLAVPAGTFPPNANAFVLLDPHPANSLLAVPKSAVSVQLVPFHDSVFAVLS